ncbi:hypothetical protein ABFS82_04G035200 [Erythranthe guttata]|uniref:Uncharacterized protein n=1 Tax=Erythranthe guttata TaxID=4155 RepID=A0A022S2F0_ERYGU|nr:hypothetical protein MIMGU_mgv1a012770mg [Erythranthe guttata]
MSTSQKDDVEAGSDLLYPLMQESPNLRWAFIRKVYSILTLQLLATIGFAAMVANVRPVADFFGATWFGMIIYFVSIILVSTTVLCMLSVYRDKHPLNFILLGIFTLTFGFAFGVLAAFTSGRIIIETSIATTVVVVCLTVYTFWAAKRGQDFFFLVPFVLSIVVILIIFTVFQIFFPMGRMFDVLCSGLSVILFCAYIIFHTAMLIERDSYDDYIWASITLYLDVLNVFLNLLSIFGRRN